MGDRMLWACLFSFISGAAFATVGWMLVIWRGRR